MQQFAAQPGVCGCISLVPLSTPSGTVMRDVSRYKLFANMQCTCCHACGYPLVSFLLVYPARGFLLMCFLAAVLSALVSWYCELFGPYGIFCFCLGAMGEIADSLAPAAIRSCSTRLMAHVISRNRGADGGVRGQLHRLAGRIQSIADGVLDS